MASIRKVKDKWLAEVRLVGHPAKSKSFATKREAQGWAFDTEQELGRHGGIVAGKTLRDAFERYSREESGKKKGARWEIIRLGKLSRDPVASVPLTKISNTHIEEWMNRQSISPASINRELNLMGSIFKACRKKWRWMIHNPMTDIERPKNPKSRDRIASNDEIELLMKALQYDGEVKAPYHEIAVAVLLAIETGMRQGELFALEPKHLHLNRGFLRIDDSKNGYGRDVPLSKKAISLFQSLPKQGNKVFGISQAVTATTFRRACKLAGIEDLHFHDLRHTAVTRLAKKLNMLELGRMIGHRDPRSLQIYYNETASEIAKRLD